jgi:hypothetical protein
MIKVTKFTKQQAQYEIVRREGRFNMFDMLGVQRAAFDLDLFELVNAITEGGYSLLLSTYEVDIQDLSWEQLAEFAGVSWDELESKLSDRQDDHDWWMEDDDEW